MQQPKLTCPVCQRAVDPSLDQCEHRAEGDCPIVIKERRILKRWWIGLFLLVVVSVWAILIAVNGLLSGSGWMGPLLIIAIAMLLIVLGGNHQLTTPNRCWSAINTHTGESWREGALFKQLVALDTVTDRQPITINVPAAIKLSQPASISALYGCWQARSTTGDTPYIHLIKHDDDAIDDAVTVVQVALLDFVASGFLVLHQAKVTRQTISQAFSGDWQTTTYQGYFMTPGAQWPPSTVGGTVEGRLIAAVQSWQTHGDTAMLSVREAITSLLPHDNDDPARRVLTLAADDAQARSLLADHRWGLRTIFKENDTLNADVTQLVQVEKTLEAPLNEALREEIRQGLQTRQRVYM